MSSQSGQGRREATSGCERGTNGRLFSGNSDLSVGSQCEQLSRSRCRPVCSWDSVEGLPHSGPGSAGLQFQEETLASCCGRPLT